MADFKRILVPVDFSACSRAALDHAYSLAERFGGTIEVVHVWNPPHYIGPDMELAFGESGQTLWDYARVAASKDLEQFLAEFQKRGTVKIGVRLEQGSPHERILGIAKSGKFDLIALGTHGRTGLSHALMGSVAERVVRHSPCRPHRSRRAQDGGRAVIIPRLALADLKRGAVFRDLDGACERDPRWTSSPDR